MHFSLPDPIRITVHSKTFRLARARKIRASWLTLATAFAIGCKSALSPLTLPHFDQASIPDIAPLTAALVAPSAPVEEAPQTASADVPELAPVVAPVAQISYPQTQQLKVASGDTFVTLLGKVGVGVQESHRILDSMGKKFNPRSLGVGDQITVTMDKLADATSPTLTKLSIPISNASTLEISRDDKGSYKVSQVDVPVVKKLARAGGNIESSLYETIVSSGMPSSMVGEIIKAYSYDVDFQREIHYGDKVDVVFEKNVTEDGKPVGYGNIIYASLDLGDRNLRIYRYTDKAGNTEYFNAKGESVRKALLRTPINGARISSGFGMREHPVLGYSKMHKGIDFAAATGTPVYASGDGIIAFVGPKGGYGNYLQIKHNATYASAYGHLSRFATGIAPGKKVKQGQIVAYVGSTGMSTGPHLHYEIIMAGNQVNPANVKFKTGTVLAGNDLKNFKHNMSTLQAKLDSLGKPSGKLAMLNIPASDITN